MPPPSAGLQLTTTVRPSPIGGGSELLERQEQLALLERLLADSRARSGSLVFLSGEAGAGKTALVSRFVSSVGDARVLLGACDGVSTPRPLGPVHDMVPALGPELAALLADEEPARRRLFDALLERLRAEPTVLVFEDLHWSDEATLDLLRFLGRRVGQLPALIVATYRDDQGAQFDPLHVVLGDLATLAWTRHMTVPSLSAAAVARLAAHRLVDAEDLYRLTGGNPFFIGEVLAGEGDVVPTTVRDAVRARVARLSSRGRNALEAAAILGFRVESWLLAAVAGEDVLGIDECLENGLLTREPAGIAFRHELTRLTVQDDLPLIRGVGLHRRALRYLEEAGSQDPARLAYHAEGAADGRAVVRHAPAAGARAKALAAHAVAIAQYRRALAFPQYLGEEERAEILEQMAYEQFLTNRLDEAYDARTEAIRMRDAAGDRLRGGDDRRYLSRVTWFLGRVPEAWEHARAAVEMLEPLGPSHELAMAWGNVGHLHMIAENLEQALDWGNRTLELGRQLDDPEVVAYALNNIGSAQLQANIEDGRAKLLESLAIAKRHEMQEHIDRALFNLGETALAHHQYDLAEGYLLECLEFTLSCDLERCQLLADASRSLARLEMGRWSEAEEMALTILRHPRVSPHGRVPALCVIARLAFRRGLAGGEAAVAEALALSQRIGEIGRLGPVAATLAEAAWLAGDHETAAERAGEVLLLALEHGDEWLIGELAAWQHRAGLLEAAPERTAEPFALEIAGKPLDAAAAWDALGNPYQAALSRAASADPDTLAQAYSSLMELGAMVPAEIVARRMRALGAAVPRGRRPATRSHPAGLTEREAEIAALLAEGLTNREIGERLVISERTVGHHVSAVLAKLGIRRRAEVGSVLEAHRAIPT
jgi:DNA-binding CsgD family transcriptional regulator/tetratricopeptide (TPR) repeat protein